MNCPVAWIVDVIIHDHTLCASFKKWIALHIACKQISYNGNFCGIVVDQRSFGMLTFGVTGMTQTFSNNIITKCDRMRSILPPFFQVIAFKPGSGS